MPSGRPREFDVNEALDRAMELFWKRGYEGTSIPDLTEAMGINRPSLYAAFGNKESLFRKALDRYAEGPAAKMREALTEPTARAVAEALLRSSANLLTDPKNPGGCMVVQGALACGEEAECVRRELAARREKLQDMIRKRFEEAKCAGDLPADTDCGNLARYIAAVSHGMAVLATGGTTRNSLLRVVEIAMRAWPAGNSKSEARNPKEDRAS